MTDRQQAWNDYWKSGALHSCIGSFGDAYQGAIGDYWQTVLRQIQPSDLVLDVATGNGPLPKLFAQTHPQLEMDAIDLADIHPTWHSRAQFPSIRFHGNCSLNDAPQRLCGAKYDHVVSQFGWEYISRPAAILDTLQMTAAGGQWHLVCHHTQGVLAQVASQEANNAELILATNGLLACASDLIPFLRTASRGAAAVSGNPAAQSARVAYNAAMDRVADEIRKTDNADLLEQGRRGVHELVLRAAQDHALDFESNLLRWRETLEAGQLRSAELVSHALTEQDIQSLQAHLKDSRLELITLDVQELRQPQGVLAWAIDVRFGQVGR